MDTPAKQQTADRIKQANKILVTVSTNPSVDQLASAIGLTLLLNRMGKHATAVFSGKVPSTIEFLQPEKTIQANTDSLRDFIISLDKSKADKLRYKVEDQVVRIFITPYRTSLSEKDLVFSQGDFNVEIVIALGVHDKSQLDSAITAHGRILHDAAIISVNAGPQNAPQIGQINWQEPTASSLCEMLVSISEAFGTGLIDNQIATAFLTGIVAETERFSNAKTSPKVMTMSAQLMAAGANQQLIVSKLDQPPPPPPKNPPQGGGQRAPKKDNRPPQPPKPPKPKPDTGTLNVSHEAAKADSPEVSISPNEIHIDEQGNLSTRAEEEMEAKKHQADLPPPPVSIPQLQPVPVEPPPPLMEPVAAPEPLPLLPPPPPPPPPPIPTSQPYLGPTPPHENEVKQDHSLLNPSDHKPSLSAPFTANTSDEAKPAWAEGDYSAPVNPLNDDRPGSHDWITDRGKTLQPGSQSQPLDFLTNRPPESYSPAPASPISVDEARKAVEMVAAAQMDNARPAPLESIGAAPLGPELHQPPPPVSNGTPTLSLPVNGNSPPPPAPPPLPPIGR